MNWCTRTPGGYIRVAVQATPNARRNEILGIAGDALKIKLQAPPVDGKANETLMRFLADMLDVSKSSVVLTQGQTSRRKVLEVSTAMSVDEVARRLLPPPAP